MILVRDKYHSQKHVFMAKNVNNNASSASKQEPMYNHRLRKKMQGGQPDHQSKTWPISAFWDINGTKAHYLLDSGCKGIRIFLSFMRAAKL
jgi:hypothetical protein